MIEHGNKSYIYVKAAAFEILKIFLGRMGEQGMFENFIQIAGVKNREEAELLIHCGVRYLGFPLRLPVHKEDLSEDEASEIIRFLPPGVQGVLITYLDRADEIARFCEELGVKLVQLHGDISADELSHLKKISPQLKIIKSLIVRENNLPQLERLTETFGMLVDAFITDTYDPQTGASGATGRVHDWAVSRRLVEISPKPLILAGGLNPANVGEAILQVRPAGVDSHTGVEDAAGRKDPLLVKEFLAGADSSFRQIGKKR